MVDEALVAAIKEQPTEALLEMFDAITRKDTKQEYRTRISRAAIMDQERFGLAFLEAVWAVLVERGYEGSI